MVNAFSGKLETKVELGVESGDSLLFIHGTPVDPAESFAAELEDQELLALLGEEAPDIIVCGGSHVAFQRMIDDYHFINVGSVGESPDGRHAFGAILETSPVGHRVQELVVEL